MYRELKNNLDTIRTDILRAIANRLKNNGDFENKDKSFLVDPRCYNHAFRSHILAVRLVSGSVEIELEEETIGPDDLQTDDLLTILDLMET